MPCGLSLDPVPPCNSSHLEANPGGFQMFDIEVPGTCYTCPRELLNVKGNGPCF